MPIVIGEMTGPSGKKCVRLAEALQKALDDAPPPSPGNDVQNFRLVSVELEHGGFTLSTVTRVTLEYSDGPLPRSDG